MAVDAGADILTMHLCKEVAPENQKFILQDVSALSLPAQLSFAGCRGRCGPGASQGHGRLQETRSLTVPPVGRSSRLPFSVPIPLTP